MEMVSQSRGSVSQMSSMQPVAPGGSGATGSAAPGGDQPYAPPAMSSSTMQHPVRLVMPFPPKFNRVQALLFTFLSIVGFLMMIPHFFLMAVYGIALYFVNIIAFFAILFTGRYPRGMWEFVRGFIQFSFRISSYMGVLTVGYPPFSLKEPSYGLLVEVPYPERSSRLWLFFASIAVIPVAFVNAFVMLAAGIVSFIASFVVLFTGNMAPTWYEFIRKAFQQRLRVQAFALWLHPKYPPFGLND